MNRHEWILKLIELADSVNESGVCYQVCGYNIPKCERNFKSVWIDGGTNISGLFDAEITDREWLKDFKNKLHPNDEWTNVDIETYGKWIRIFNDKEGSQIVNAALEAGVVGYLD